MNRKSRKKEALTPYERRKRRLEKRFSTAPKTTGQKVAGAVIDNICWIVGCSLYSIGVVAFALPNSIAQSGTTGLAIIVNHLFEFIPLGTANFLLNVPLMVLAFIFIGWRFVAKTMWVTVILSAKLDPAGSAQAVDLLVVVKMARLVEGRGNDDALNRLVRQRDDALDRVFSAEVQFS